MTSVINYIKSSIFYKTCLKFTFYDVPQMIYGRRLVYFVISVLKNNNSIYANPFCRHLELQGH